MSKILLVLFVDLVMTAGGITFLAYNNYILRQVEDINGQLNREQIVNQNTTLENQKLIKHNLAESHYDNGLIKRTLNQTAAQNTKIENILDKLQSHMSSDTMKFRNITK